MCWPSKLACLPQATRDVTSVNSCDSVFNEPFLFGKTRNSLFQTHSFLVTWTCNPILDRFLATWPVCNISRAVVYVFTDQKDFQEGTRSAKCGANELPCSHRPQVVGVFGDFSCGWERFVGTFCGFLLGELFQKSCEPQLLQIWQNHEKQRNVDGFRGLNPVANCMTPTIWKECCVQNKIPIFEKKKKHDLHV